MCGLEQWPLDERPDGATGESRRLVQPRDGFRGKEIAPREASQQRRERTFVRHLYLAGSGVEERAEEGAVRRVQIQRARMAVLNEGPRGEGFERCAACGYAVPYGSHKGKGKHENPRGGRCDGPLERVSLGGEYETDALRIELPQAGSGRYGYWALLGVAQVLGRCLAEELETPAAEIGASANLAPGGTPTILLYDTVPGGAMLSTQMMDDALFRRVLARAVERTDGGCGCGPEGNCSSCLRWYENRWAHPYVKRGAVNAWLRRVEREFERGVRTPDKRLVKNFDD